MTDKEKLVNLLIECYTQSIFYGYDNYLNWFPDGKKVNEVWNELFQILNVQDMVNVDENGVIEKV